MRILAEGIAVSNDTRETGLNNNTLIIGSSGSGKTRSFVIPNILAAEGSVVVTDTKGDLCDTCRKRLERRGYRVLCIDFSDCAQSQVGYDSLEYVRMIDDKPYEQDILSIAASLCPIESQEPFWDYAARELMSSMIAYAVTCLPPEEANMVSVCKLFDLIPDGRYEKLLDQIKAEDPSAFCVRQYSSTRAAKDAEKMIGSIRGIVGAKLAQYRFDGVTHLSTMSNRIYFESLRREKTALFVNVSDTDRSLDRMVALFFEQLFRTLINSKERNSEPFYPVHVIMDDFACGCPIGHFDNIISVIRSRGIYASAIVQSITQLETLYGARAATIMENCDTVLYLGGNDVGTARWIGERANKPAHSILTMPVEDALLLQRGKAARKVRRYRMEKHHEPGSREPGSRRKEAETENEGICV